MFRKLRVHILHNDMSAVCFKKRWGRVEAGNKDETLAVADNY